MIPFENISCASRNLIIKNEKVIPNEVKESLLIDCDVLRPRNDKEIKTNKH